MSWSIHPKSIGEGLAEIDHAISMEDKTMGLLFYTEIREQATKLDDVLDRSGFASIRICERIAMIIPDRF